MKAANLMDTDKLLASGARVLRTAKKLKSRLQGVAATSLGTGNTRFVPPPPQIGGDEEESDSTWGFS
ncbi:MAG: hypothetical protein HY902_03285, partial [Deltaproteobacteria bacterium]|nr:hypothetical protein [Deltaproteobacteria bacterium]